ncbi:RICIN domain-containing protein [Pseudoalteromonas sp. MMG006]|uniref:RICIN domain-containing protein n=1 Tax=Pseudoalteromonas sp. MMG006 TaxID=2822683 RepID=UPI001B37953B|nr:RICIN domain-containing protein [Pseudoalteromonas sp. MMG006]MBQ4798861.1 RICIN domain-containing protein [Pseudoalteromonas sp. MMG006]
MSFLTFKIKIIILGLFVFNNVYANDSLSHDFNDGTLGSYFECTSKAPNFTRVESGRVITHWYEKGYDGTRTSKGTEACAPLDDFKSTKETWLGFTINIEENHTTDTESGIAQIFQFVDNSDIFTWAGMLKYEQGDLTFVRRSANNTSSQVQRVVEANFTKGEDHQIIIHYILSANNTGKIEIWVDNVLKYGHYNINFGFGNFNHNDSQYDDTYVELKFGQYNYAVDEYRNNEERIIYYDNMTWYNGTDGYSVVDPSPSKLFHITKFNASEFAIDGNNDSENGQNVYLWSSRTTNNNQKWYEIDRGNGYYSYQKYKTGYCLDGGNGADNGQNIYLWQCEDNNQNQHWKKVYVKANTYHLTKRNAPLYAIDGNNTGNDGQNIYLWKARDTNQNQQWVFKELD